MSSSSDIKELKDTISIVVDKLQRGQTYNWFMMCDCIIGHIVKEVIGQELFDELIPGLDHHGSSWCKAITKLRNHSQLTRSETKLIEVIECWQLSNRDIYELENLANYNILSHHYGQNKRDTIQSLNKHERKDVISYLAYLIEQDCFPRKEQLSHEPLEAKYNYALAV